MSLLVTTVTYQSHIQLLMWVVNCNCQVLVSHHCQFPVIVNVASCQLSTVVSCCLPQSPLSVSIVTTRCTFQLSLSGVIVSHHCQFPFIVSCQLPFVSCQFLVVTTISVNCYYHLLYLHLPLVVIVIVQPPSIMTVSCHFQFSLSIVIVCCHCCCHCLLYVTVWWMSL